MKSFKTWDPRARSRIQEEKRRRAAEAGEARKAAAGK